MRDDDSPVCSKSMLSLPMTPNENRSRLAVQQKIQKCKKKRNGTLVVVVGLLIHHLVKTRGGASHLMRFIFFIFQSFQKKLFFLSPFFLVLQSCEFLSPQKEIVEMAMDLLTSLTIRACSLQLELQNESV